MTVHRTGLADLPKRVFSKSYNPEKTKPEELPKMTGDPRTVLVTVSPMLAEKMLEMNHANRLPNAARVHAFAKDMVEGKWVVNGATIVLDDGDQLLDGQHRLMAVIESGVPLKTFVTYGVKPEVGTTIDQGRTRTASDYFRMQGRAAADPHSYTAALRLQGRVDDDDWSFKGRISSVNALLDIEARHPELVVSIPAARDAYKQCRMFKSVAMVAMSVTRLLAPQTAAAFEEGLTTGVGLEERDPRLALRQFCMSPHNRNRNSIDTQHRQLRAYFDAFNAFAAGLPLARIHIRDIDYLNVPKAGI